MGCTPELNGAHKLTNGLQFLMNSGFGPFSAVFFPDVRLVNILLQVSISISCSSSFCLDLGPITRQKGYCKPMMMKSILITLMFYGFTQQLNAQITGMVAAEGGEKIPFANVLLLQAADSSFAKGGLTDDEGRFLFEEVEKGRYLIRISNLGFSTWISQPFEIAGPDIPRDFGLQTLHAEAIQLEGLEVRARKGLLQQQAEGAVFNVEGSVMTRGSSALQVLERSPGVFIDRRNNDISLNGQNGVLLMINGKQLRLPVAEAVNLLSGMSADNLEKIELLTAPSAKHDAEGSAGIINIVFKKNDLEGTNGSFSLTGGHGWGPKGAGSFNLSRQRGGNRISGGYAFSYDETYSDLHGMGSEIVPALGGDLDFDFKNVSKRIRRSHQFSLGLERDLAAHSAIGASLSYQFSNDGSGAFNRSHYEIDPDSMVNIRVNIAGQDKWNHLVSNVFFEKQFDGGAKLKLNGDYLHYRHQNPTLAGNQYSNGRGEPIYPQGGLYAEAIKGHSRTSIHIGVLKLDWEKTFSSGIRLETGLKGSYAESANLGSLERMEQEEWVADERSRTNLRVTEGIGAAYSSVYLPLGTSANLTLGARYEYWDQQFDDTTPGRRFGKLFPSLFFSKRFSEETQLRFSYTKRITRPDYNDLASYLAYNDPISVYSGNPLLKPAISNQFKGGIQYKTANFSAWYGYTDNPIARYQIVENAGSDLVIISPQNVDWQRTYNVQADLPVDFSKWWSANFGLIAGYNRFKLSYTHEPVEESFWACGLNGSQTFTLPERWSLELSGWYVSRHYNGSVKVGGFGMLNAGVKHELKNGRGSFQLSVSDLMGSMRITSHLGTIGNEAFLVKADVVYRAESAVAPILKLTYFQSFGNTQLKTRTRRNDDPEEEQSRIRKE